MQISLPSEMRQVRRLSQEWIYATVLALGIIVLTLVPYVMGFALTRPGAEFTGVLMNPEDTNSYLAKMQQGYEGAWLYSIPFTSEEHAPAFLGGFYILLGHIASFFNLSIIEMWFVARITFSLTMFLTAYGFIGHFSTDVRTRWTGFGLALTGSGFGWIIFALGQTNWLGDFPVDFKMPEAHLFFSAFTFPHFAAGVTLILGSLWLSIRSFESKNVLFALGAGTLNLAIAIVYPFLIYLIAVVLALYWLNLWFATKSLPYFAGVAASIALFFPFPLLVYYDYVLQTNSVFRAWDAQAVTPSPNPLHYLVAYGAMLLFAAPTLREEKLRPLWLWVLATALLVYAPLNPQRRFVEGVQVPLSILAAVGLVSYYLPRLRACTLFQRLATRPNYSALGLERFVLVGLVAFLAMSNLYVLVSTGVTAAIQQPYPLFRPLPEVQAIDWAGANLPSRAVIMSAYESGNLIPTRTGLRTVIGHWAETIDFQNKYDEVAAFYSQGVSDEWRANLLAAEHVEYVFYGPGESGLGKHDPADEPGLTGVYRDGKVEIFRVNK